MTPDVDFTVPIDDTFIKVNFFFFLLTRSQFLLVSSSTIAIIMLSILDTNMLVFLTHYPEEWYHHRDYRGRNHQQGGPTELFNYKHSSLGNVNESYCGVLKARFSYWRWYQIILYDDNDEFLLCILFLQFYKKRG